MYVILSIAIGPFIRFVFVDINILMKPTVDKYKLDLAIISGNNKLDIEVDGKMYHQTWDGEICYRDQLRNQRLFELGWDVIRFWVPDIRDDMNGCIKKIVEWMDNHNMQRRLS